MLNVLMSPRSQFLMPGMALLSTYERLALFEILHLTLGDRTSRLSAIYKIKEYMSVACNHNLDDEAKHMYCYKLHAIVLRDLAYVIRELQYLWKDHGITWDGENPSLKYMAISIVNYIVDDFAEENSELLRLLTTLEKTANLI